MGASMEGKAVQFGPVLSAEFAAVSTGSGDGAVVGFVLILGALTFFPALALAPVLEQLRLAAGHLFH